jgi:hypothetical protein
MIIHPFIIDKNGNINHTRGDTAQFSLQVKHDGLDIPTFNATFSVKQYPDDTAYLYQVFFDNNTPCIIGHDLTLNIPYGQYWWDVQVTYQRNGVLQYKTIGAFPYYLNPDITN